MEVGGSSPPGRTVRKKGNWCLPSGLIRDVFTSEWGCSSVGRAPAWHAGGQGFKSPQLHHVVVYDRYGRMLNPEELAEFAEDLWDLGLPPDPPEGIIVLWKKWGDRMGIPRPDALFEKLGH